MTSSQGYTEQVITGTSAMTRSQVQRSTCELLFRSAEVYTSMQYKDHTSQNQRLSLQLVGVFAYDIHVYLCYAFIICHDCK